MVACVDVSFGSPQALPSAANFGLAASDRRGSLLPCRRRAARGRAGRRRAATTSLCAANPILPAPFTAPERDLLRRELCRHFGQDPSIADGIFLRTWRGGERRNQPKIPPAVQTMG